MVSNKNIKNLITYVVIDTRAYELSLIALRHSNSKFPLNNIIIYSNNVEKWCEFSKYVQIIEPMKSMDEYSSVIFDRIPNDLETEYYLILHWDGFVLNPQKFTDIFLEYDYIGAIWPWFNGNRVGNGGFSLRSRKLIDAIKNCKDNINAGEAEDVFICRRLHNELTEKYGIKFAPEEVANHFSFEYSRQPVSGSFGFHGVHILPLIYKDSIKFLIDRMHVESLVKYKDALHPGIASLSPEAEKYFLSKLPKDR